MILAIDPERERISLGIKQLERDPFELFVADHPKGSIVKGTVTDVDARGVTVALSDNVTGYIRVSELSRDRVEDARTVLNVGDEVEARFVAIDRKNHNIMLSIKAKDVYDEAEAIREYSQQAADEGSSTATTLGDLIKEQMKNR